MSPLLIGCLRFHGKIYGDYTYLEIICFDEDIFHIWREFPTSPRDHLTILLQAKFREFSWK
jgi:hypothetical protein